MVQFVALLFMATLFGGMMLYSFGFAALVFSALPPAQAGPFIRIAFPWYYLFVIVVSALAGVVLWRSDPRSCAVALAIATVGVFARQVLMPQINRATDDHLAGSAAARPRFARLHGLSVVLNLLQLFGAGWILHRFL